ncbi:hypothetical protein GCM10022220_64280 [Actinocatenispora rupis]|uniref:Uncharacterized protein n=1 Tax=Actinocatenispora rupis TaxID=519421 RepID=A0A8J3IZ34_9ACTN|nr:hypothetical protein Aru02nite_35750 [Actinocatenispora rupis]
MHLHHLAQNRRHFLTVMALGLLATAGCDTTARPYMRPPFGARNPDTDGIAADLGYIRILMWDGTLGDSQPLTPHGLMANARRWIRGGPHRPRPHQPPHRHPPVRTEPAPHQPTPTRARHPRHPVRHQPGHRMNPAQPCQGGVWFQPHRGTSAGPISGGSSPEYTNAIRVPHST